MGEVRSIKFSVKNKVTSILASTFISLIILLGWIIFSLGKLESYDVEFYGYQSLMIRALRGVIIPSIVTFIAMVLLSNIVTKIGMGARSKYLLQGSKNSNYMVDKIKVIVLPIISSILVFILLVNKFSNNNSDIYIMYKSYVWYMLPIVSLITSLCIYLPDIFIYVKKVHENEIEETKKLTEDYTNNQKKKCNDKLNEYIVEVRNLDNEYTQNIDLCNLKDINYDKKSFENGYRFDQFKNPKSMNIKYENNTIFYENSNKSIYRCTNDERTILLERQIDSIKKKFNINSLDELEEKLSEVYRVRELSDFSRVFDNIKLLENVESRYISYSQNNGLPSAINQRYEIMNDIIKLISNRVNYLNSTYRISKLGTEGEENVSKELAKYSDEFINIENKNFDFSKIDFIDENYTMECDNILITQYGVFVLETKNIGINSTNTSGGYNNGKNRLYSKYILHIEKDGRWVRRYQDGGFDIIERNPEVQNRDHVLKLTKILNTMLNRDIDDEDYINVKGIVVIANDHISIQNDTNIAVCRENSIYTQITLNNEKILTRQAMKEIKDMIDSYKKSDHKPTRYAVLGVYDEISNLAAKINDLQEQNILGDSYADYVNNSSNFNSQINKLTSTYGEIIRDITLVNDNAKFETMSKSKIINKLLEEVL